MTLAPARKESGGVLTRAGAPGRMPSILGPSRAGRGGARPGGDRQGKMTRKKYCFISGLPRSGSTLLANLLAQNPRFHASATSGILDVVFGVRNHWDQLPQFQAMDDRA